MSTSVSPKVVSLPWYKKKIRSVKLVPFTFSIFAFILFLILPIIDQTPAHRCGALLTLIAILWGTEAIPVVATAMIIPLPVVTMGLLLDSNGEPLDSVKAASEICFQYFDPVVILFLGGFTIAKALEKYGISSALASWTLNKAGTSPSRILFAIMFLGMFLSMWISNVAASVLCVSAVIPIIKNQLERDDPYIRALLLGIAFSCNIGGMTTPIASPQNAIALHSLRNVHDPKTGKYVTQNVTFIDWMAVSMPFCLVLLVITWRFLLWMYPSNVSEIIMGRAKAHDQEDILIPQIETEPRSMSLSHEKENNIGEFSISEPSISVSFEMNQGHNSESEPLLKTSTPENSIQDTIDKGVVTFKWTNERIFVMAVVFITVGLWCTEPLHQKWTGSIGIIAVIPVFVFFGTGLLTVQEFDNLTWSVLILMGGGLALGHAIQNSRLLAVAAHALGKAVQHSSIWVILLSFSCMMGGIANFISSTVAAIIILPVMAVIGVQHNHLRMLVINSALMCSGAMALPVSSFPNANSFSVVDKYSIPYAPTIEYIRSGLPMTFFAVASTASIGYFLSLALGF